MASDEVPQFPGMDGDSFISREQADRGIENLIRINESPQPSEDEKNRAIAGAIRQEIERSRGIRIKVGDTVYHKDDPFETQMTVTKVFTWLGRRKVIAQDDDGEYYKDWMDYFHE